MTKRGSQMLVFTITFIVWMLLTWKVEPTDMLFGLLFALIASMFFGELMTVTPERTLEITRYLWLLYFIPVFLWQMVKSNLDVAYRVLHPKLPINPGLIKVKTSLKSDVSKAFLGNSLTLTPGNTTVDIIGDELYIHCIDVDRHVREEVERFEKIIARIFE